MFPAWLTEQDLQVFVDAVAVGDFRGSLLLPDVGHWVQQEAADATNRALRDFLSGLA